MTCNTAHQPLKLQNYVKEINKLLLGELHDNVANSCFIFYVHVQPNRVLRDWELIIYLILSNIPFGIWTYISSSSPLLRAFLAMHWKASSTLMPSLAEVSKYGIFPFDAHQARAFFSETWSIKNNRKFQSSIIRTGIIRKEGRIQNGNLGNTYNSTVSTINVNFIS